MANIHFVAMLLMRIGEGIGGVRVNDFLAALEIFRKELFAILGRDVPGDARDVGQLGSSFGT